MPDVFAPIRAKVVQADQLAHLRAAHPGRTIVFCTGCYDILQSGHAVYFNQCKAFGDLLVVGVGRDTVIEQLKGKGRPVNPEANRLYLVAALQDVDYAVLNGPDIEPGKIDFRDVLTHLRPDVFVLNDDDSAMAPKRALCDGLGIRLEFVSRTVPPELTPTSTTAIINKINYALKAPLRIDFAGGWTDVPFLMNGQTGYVSNVAIRPLVEYKGGQFNFAGYPRGSGLSTSTAAKLLEMLNAKQYNAEGKTLTQVAEDLFQLENQELNWAIGRQDQYAIVFGGFHCFAFDQHGATALPLDISRDTLEAFRAGLLIIHTGESRNAQQAVEGVYQNYQTPDGQAALAKLARYGREFGEALATKNFDRCARLMDANWQAQKQLSPASTTPQLDTMHAFARANGATGGKLCGAGGGGAFVFYCQNPAALKTAMKQQFVGCFEIDFAFEYDDIKQLNHG